jgi:hypothetical protein
MNKKDLEFAVAPPICEKKRTANREQKYFVMVVFMNLEFQWPLSE